MKSISNWKHSTPLTIHSTVYRICNKIVQIWKYSTYYSIRVLCIEVVTREKWSKEDRLTSNPFNLIPLDKTLHPILWEIRNDHRPSFPFTEVDNLSFNFVIFNFLVYRWCNRYAPTLGQGSHGMTVLHHTYSSDFYSA